MSKANQKAIAILAGVSQSTVSLALRGSKEVSPPQRTRIRRIARRMQYRPSSDAQRMAARRRGKSLEGPALAWINQEKTEDFWHVHPISRAYWRGANKRAQQLGYSISNFWLHDQGLTQHRLAEILINRGIEAILLPRYADSGMDMKLNIWQRFAAVSLNHPMLPPVMDHVRADFEYNIDICMKYLLKKRHRIGLVVKEIFNEETRSATLARFIFHASTLSKDLQIPPLIVPDYFEEKVLRIRDWLREWRPDILLVRDYEISDILTRCAMNKARLPSIIQLQLNELTPRYAGVDEQNEEVGSAAVDLLCGKLHQMQFGFSAPSRELLIKGIFHRIRKRISQR